jgi:hypothetical protein
MTSNEYEGTKKEVIAVYWDSKFQQFLMKSEVRLLLQIMKDHKRVTIEYCNISDESYKSHFGK